MNPKRPSILLVGDTRTHLVAVQRQLAGVDAELVEADSGNQALALCPDHEFALILLDVHGIDMDGCEIAARLGEVEWLKGMPVIFITATDADGLNCLQGHPSGTADYITRPVNDHILQSKVRVFLELHAARTQWRQALEELAECRLQLLAENTERERIEAKVRHQATHDTLTGLPNRALFHDRLRASMQRGAHHDSGFALALVDIDGFRTVNDTWGQLAGDDLLRSIAARLGSHVRPNDTVARLGGNEFALILEDVADVPLLMERCQHLCNTLALPYPLETSHREFVARVSASIGMALWNGDVDAGESLIRAADRALREARANGRNRCVLSSQES